MSRVPYLSREQLPPEKREIHDRMAEARGGRLPQVFQLLLNAPDFASRIGEVGAFARFHTKFPGDVREIGILATSRELGCQYEFTHHAPLALKEGVRDVVIQGIINRTTKGMLPKESVFVEYATKVVNNRVDDATFAAVEHLLGRQGAVEFTMMVGYYTMLGHTMLALGVELEPGTRPLLPEGNQALT